MKTNWFAFFPRKAARRFVITQGIFFFFLIAIAVLSVRFYLVEKAQAYPEFYMLISDVDSFLVKLAWLLFFLGIGFTLWASYINFYPLGRLLAKAKNIKRGTYKRQWDQEVEPGQDFGEWYELELTLNKINREIKKHKQDKRRQASEIEALAGAVSDGVIAVDSLKRVQFFNGQMALILGKVFDPLSPPSYLDEVFRAPKLTLAVDEVLQTSQVRRIQIPLRPSKRAENHIFDVSVTPVISEKKNHFYGVIAVFHDITEAKKVDEVRIDFVANASHELKTPLTSIKGYVDALLVDMERSDHAAAKEKVQVIEKNVNRLNELVKDLLALSRLSAGDEASKEENSTEEITEMVLQELRPLMAAKNQTVKSVFKVPSVKANSAMLGQVISNLIENAIKYCPPGIHIQVIWEQDEQFVKLKVSDNGPGLSEEHHSRVFERFYRVQNGKTTSGVSGTGLGLSIVKNSMLKMGGRIEVDSLPGRGSDFTCYFPKH